MKIQTRGMRAGSLFKFLWTSNTFGMLPFVIIFVMAGLFGADILTINFQPMRGLLALPFAGIMWLAIATWLSLIQWILMTIGFGLYSRWGRVKLAFKDASLQ